MQEVNLRHFRKLLHILHLQRPQNTERTTDSPGTQPYECRKSVVQSAPCEIRILAMLTPELIRCKALPEGLNRHLPSSVRRPAWEPSRRSRPCRQGSPAAAPPRSFSFDPTGRFSYCCNQWADNVTVFRVDRDKGTLTFTNQYTPVGNPSIIIFLDLAKTQR